MLRRALAFVLAVSALTAVGRADEIASTHFDIVGIALEVVDSNVTTGVDIPAVVRTKFGGLMDDAVPATDMIVAGELTGPGLDAPITLTTQPGHRFTLPPLHEKGDYTLQNIRLVDASGKFVQTAVPSAAVITVTGVLDTSVTVRQLSPDDLRARGITVDSRNYDVYDYNFVFGINGQTVSVPYPVIIDRRTHEVITPPGPSEYKLPTPTVAGPPPRFQPPLVIPTILEDELGGGGTPEQSGAGGEAQRRKRPSIPAAIVIPTGFGVLHQFFAVILNVSNSTPLGSQIQLDAIAATIATPTGMRVVKVNPAVTLGQAVPIRDAATGATFLIAQAQGSADWSLESLRAGTHTIDLDIRATYKSPNQVDIPLHGHVTSAIVVSDPRFQINFVHPDNIRVDESYTAYAFITNTSAQQQSVRIDLAGIPTCGSGFANHICRVTGVATIDQTFAPGQTIPIAYKLKSDLTGHIFAAAGDAPDGITTTVSLQMGVSASGIPLSPATLVLPFYAQFVNASLVDAQLPLLGLGYSLATAPLTPSLASMPRLIRNDVFTRAQDIARAGQRIFVARQTLATDNAAEDHEPMFHLALDLLGNVERVDRLDRTADLREWDQLRRMETTGRTAGAAMARELERVGLANGKSMRDFAADFASATSHRSPFVFALVHGAPVAGNARPYAMAISGVTSKTSMSVPAEIPGATRTLAFGELTRFTSASESGELAIVGRFSESLQLSINAASPSFTVELIYPDTTPGSTNDKMLRTSFDVTNASPSTPVTLTIDRGNRALIVSGATAVPLVDDVAPTPLAVVHAAQDLHLDSAGHIVTLMFNRPVKVDDAAALRNLFKLTTNVPAANVSVARKNNPADPAAPIVIPGAALQDDGLLLNVSFDHALSKNAQYVIGIDPIVDLLTPAVTYSNTNIVPRIDNDAPGGIIVGKVIRGDGSFVKNTLVALTSGTMQFDTTLPDGAFLFEFVARDIDRGLTGNYKLEVTDTDGKYASLDGVIRTPGEVQRIVLQFLGRGTATGRVMYSDGTVLPNATVTAGSTIYAEFHRATTDANGVYTITDLPVGPITFAVNDPKGNVTYAANQIRTPGEVVTQDLVIQKRDLPGFGTVRVTVRRSDLRDTNGALVVVAGAHVGVYTQGYGLVDGYTDNSGKFEFAKIPSGVISILAAEFSLTRESAGVDLDLKPDTTLDQTLVLHVPNAAEQAQLATVEGDVKRDDPTAPNDRTRDVLVPNAVVSIRGLAPVVADANGHYVCTGVPVALSGKNFVSVFDPATGRRATATLPNPLNAGASNTLPILLRTAVPQGTATFRVRLTAATGEPVSDYHVIWPGYPPDEFTNVGAGIYEFTANVPQTIDVWAVPHGRHVKYGDQVGHTTMRADFDGQIVVHDVRLPGQGSVKARVLVQKRCPDATPDCPVVYDVGAGTIGVAYLVWHDGEQGMVVQDREPVATDPVTGVATITGVPVGNASVETLAHPSGYASGNVVIRFDADERSIDLRLSTLGDVSGRVVNYDGVTPIAGASVRFAGSFANMGPITTGADGTFRFNAVAASQGFRITAEATDNGIYRTGFVTSGTPAGGGPVSGLVVVMRQQANISGTVVDAANAPVPQARYWARELAWPYRQFGSASDPLTAGNDGRFFLNNVFSGGVRITAVSPVHQEDRGDAQVEIGFEGDDKPDVRLTIGSAGTSSISVTVFDSSNGYMLVPNAEVTLFRDNAAFDFASTNQNGVVSFENVPVAYPNGAQSVYSVRATSKVVGRAGAVGNVRLTRDVPSQVQVALTLTGRVSGTLVDGDIPSLPPVKGMPVYLYASSFYTVTSTGGIGDFLFNGVPEGSFRLEALDLDSGRKAVNTTPLFIDKLFPDRADILLKLEKTATLKVKVYLPDDAGNASSVLAPLVDVKVTQANYSRELQGASSELNFAKMFTNRAFHLEARELGGEGRIIRYDGFIPAETFAPEVSLRFSTSGTVRVEVTADDPSVIPGASVAISGAGKGASVFADATGIITINDMPLGNVSVQVVSGSLSASASGTLSSHSVPLVLKVKLGHFAAIDGYVDAELGGVSIGTRVVASVHSPGIVGGGMTLETRTDASGHYLFRGIPVSSTTVTLAFFGPDETTVGATLANVSIPNGAQGTLTMTRVRLDATPPSVIGLDPANNANSVAPNAHIFVTFSEPMDLAYVNASYFQLTTVDNGANVPASITPEIVGGQWRVHVAPLAQLRSNVIHRLFISDAVKDASGNKMKTSVSTSFTTVNYTEPKIIRAEPSVDLPLAEGSSFRLKFNKPVDVHSFDAGQGGVALVEKLDTYKGQPVAVIPIVAPFLDAGDPSTLVLAPTGVAIQPSSFYRVTVSGVRDTQTPANVQSAAQSFDYFSFDLIKPVVTIVSPLAASTPLVAGGTYSVTATVADEGSGTPSKDIQSVDWFTTDGTSDTFALRARVAPYAYLLHVPVGATSLTLKAGATDLSNNTSDVAAFTWQVVANQPPQNVTLTPSKSSVYLRNHFDATVAFTDEGTTATVSLAVVGKRTDGSDYPLPSSAITPSINRQATRANTTAPWPVVTFGVDVPSDMKEGEPLHVTATVKDSDQQASSLTVDVALAADAVAPAITSIAPAAESHFRFVSGGANTFPITIKAQDAESGVARVHVSYDGNELDLTTGSFSAATSTWAFATTGHITAKYTDTRIHITATAYDYHGNPTSSTSDIIFDSVNDGSFPTAEWITPVDGAALPAGDAITLKLRLHDRRADTVAFTSPAFTTQPPALTAPNSGSEVYEQSVTFTVPAASFTITATVSDADHSHEITLPITIDPVAVDFRIPGDASIDASTASTYAGKSIVVSGGGTDLYVKVPLTLKNLIVLGGARVGNPDRVKLDLTIQDHLFIDGDSAIELTAKGFLGAWRQSEDLSFTNSSPRGMTLGGTSTAGALSSAASHAGIGAHDAINVTNATYGSITDPSDFGSGGGGSPACCVVGANGGGALALHAATARVALAGAIRADGGTGLCGSPCIWGAAAGGSISMTAKSLVTGYVARITANGGDDNAFANATSAAGGGRVAVRVSERLDLDAAMPILQARGGRNGAGEEGSNYIDGGAGTVFLSRPGATNGQLIVSSHDERYPSSTHRTLGTPLAGILAFDGISIGPRALARFDSDSTVPDPSAFTADATALVLLPADQPQLTVTTSAAAGSSLPQATNLVVTYTATSTDGIAFVRLPFTAAASETIEHFGLHPTNVTNRQTTLGVASTAATGNADLRLHAETRSGRTADTPATSFTIVANTSPVIDRFTVAPLQLYAGHTISVDAAASDDVGVTSLTLATSAGSLASGSPVTSGTSMSRAFTVAIPVTTPSGTNVQLTLSASDGFPGRAATTQTQSVAILADPAAPAITITKPAAAAAFTEGTQIAVEATIVDAEVGVKQASVALDGVSKPLTADPLRANVFVATIQAPDVDGSADVTKQIVVTATDYENNTSTATLDVTVKPLIDPNAPTIAWTCASPGAMFPTGYVAKLRVNAKGANASNFVSKVEFNVPGQPLITATSLGSDLYEATFTTPATAQTLTVRAIATSISGNVSDLVTTITIIASDITYSANTTLITGDTSTNGKVVAVVGTATLTLLGDHSFAKLLVLDTAKVTHPATDATTIQKLGVLAQDVYVACGAAIDVSGRGFGGTSNGIGRTWPNTFAGGSASQSGGSHGGRGGLNSAATYGSVYDPATPGGSGAIGFNGACATCNAGGGVARVQATTLVLDGKMIANGVGNSSTTSGNGGAGGAGGSIRVDANNVSGVGEIHADGVAWLNSSGGGGRVAIYYQTLTLDRTKITAGGGNSGGTLSNGGSGTIYMRLVDSTGTRVTDELIADNVNVSADRGATLPSLGTGTVTAVSGAVVTLSSPVPEWTIGSTIEFLTASGTVSSSYEIVATTTNSVTVKLQAGESSASVQAGTSYRGVWNLATVTVKRQGVLDAPTVAATTIALASSVGLMRFANLRFDSGTILGGRLEAGTVTARNLTLTSGAILTQVPTDGTAIRSLQVSVSETLTIDATSSIDVSGRGFGGTSNGIGRTWPNTFAGGSGGASGGSHGGRGGLNSAATYGSVYDPATPGGSGAIGFNGACGTCNAGGGVARVQATTLVLDGKMIANGVGNSSTTSGNGGAGGAGGSIRVDANNVSGVGEIHADGVAWLNSSGGGGRVAIYYQTLTLDRTKITAGGGNSNATTLNGGSGTVYLRLVDSTGTRVSDELIADNVNVSADRGATLPSLGAGTVTAVSGAVVTLSSAVPEWMIGSTIEFLTASGTVLTSYEIVATTTNTVTVKLPAGQSSASVQAGTSYRGVWNLATVTVKRQGVLDAPTVAATTIALASSVGLMRFANLRFDSGTILGGRVEAGTVTARNLTLASGAILTQVPTDGTTMRTLQVSVNETLTIDATSAIDVSGRGFIGTSGGIGRTWPNTFTGGSAAVSGGSHGGRGGLNSAATYGSVYDAATPGGSGGIGGNTTCGTCNAGGGVARVQAATLVLDGRMIANGVGNSSTTSGNGGGGGAGGSIRVDVNNLSGLGEIHADGAAWLNSSGGGGRIAIYYQTLTLDRTKITASGGNNNSTSNNGGSGTIYLKSSAQAFGDLILQNATSANAATTLTSIGARNVDAVVGADGVRTTNANFLNPDHLKGIRLTLNGDTTKRWPILTNTADTIRVDATAPPFAPAIGDRYRGLYIFDSLKLRNTTLTSNDVVQLNTPIDKDAGSSLIFNAAAPSFPVATRSQIRVISTVSGDTVSGPAGAVIDTDPAVAGSLADLPIKLTVTSSHGVSVTGNAVADGSFSIAVGGPIGETFTIAATDSHSLPLSSATIPVNGAITETAVVASLTVQPTTVVGGTTAFGTVRLTAPARSSGAVVLLSSSNAAAVVPTTVTVLGGLSSAQFPITTTSPVGQVQAVITATLTNAQTATLIITPSTAALASLTLSAASIEGGASLNGTVTLGSPASAAEAVVSLSTNSPSVSLPLTVIVPTGATQTTFTITTSKVATLVSTAIYASYGTTKSAALDLTSCTAMGTPIPPASTALKTTWVDDALPANATATGEATFDNTQVAKGSLALHFAPPLPSSSSAVRTYSFTGASPLSVAPGDDLVLHALVNPCNPPRQILVTWSDGATTYRASWGESRIQPTTTHKHVGSVPAGEIWTRLEVIASSLGIATNKNLTGLTIAVDGGEAWFDPIGVAACALATAPKPAYLSNETIWFDDSLPAGAASSCTAYGWDTTQAASGTAADRVANAAGMHQHCFIGASDGMTVSMSDVITTYVLIDPCNPPRQLMLQFNDGTGWNRRVYWGESLIVGGAINTPELRRMGALPEAGKWVRLEVPVSSMQLTGMTLRGVAFTLYDGQAWFDRVGKVSRVNLALGKTATQSSKEPCPDPCNTPGLAIDGDVSTFQHTANQLEAWWQVDLGAVQPIESIDVWNGGLNLCCQDRMSRFWVFVSEEPFTSTSVAATLAQPGVTAYYHLTNGGRPSTFDVARNGRYIRVQISGTNYLHAAEVQVWAPVTPQPPNLAAGRTATQSSALFSSGFSYIAALAVNGESMGGDPAHTNSDPGAWWQVDLGSVQNISTVDISNVTWFASTTCCTQRMSNFYLFVSDTPFSSNIYTDILNQSGVSAWYRGSPITAYDYSINRTGRFVRIALTGTDFLHSMEVKVMSPSLSIGALAKPTTPTSTNTFDFATAAGSGK